MDYKEYSELLSQYRELDKTPFDSKESIDDIVGKLMHISAEKSE